MNSSSNARGRMEIVSQGWGDGKVAPLILTGWQCHKIIPQGRSQRSQEDSGKYTVITVLLELQQNPWSPWKHLNFA